MQDAASEPPRICLPRPRMNSCEPSARSGDLLGLYATYQPPCAHRPGRRTPPQPRGRSIPSGCPRSGGRCGASAPRWPSAPQGRSWFVSSPPHRATNCASSCYPSLAAAPLQDVVGEEVDVACRLVEVVGAEALIDLGREDLFPFVEDHRDLHDTVGVDCLRVERSTHPLTGVLFGDELSPPFGSRDSSIPSSLPSHRGQSTAGRIS